MKYLLTTILSSYLLLTCRSVFAQDQQEWWFDVEIAVFKRSLSPALQEDFSAADFEFSSTRPIDLFSLHLLEEQNALSYLMINACSKQDEQFAATSEFSHLSETNEMNTTAAEQIQNKDSALSILSDDLNASLNVSRDSLLCDLQDVTGINAVPTRLFSDKPYIFDSNALLSENQLQMQKYVERVFRQRDIQAMLYTIWRQEVVFGENNADFYKIFAGEKLTLEPKTSAFDAVESEETVSTEQEDNFSIILANIKQALDNPQKVNWQTASVNSSENEAYAKDSFKGFELEGLMKVYLEYVGSIPYLHIDAEFKHHSIELNAEGNPKLLTYPFKQRRRIISRQIHYFDHPAFGVLVRLNRYQKPSPEELIIQRESE